MPASKPGMRWMGSRNFTPGVYDKSEIVLHWAVGRMAMMDSMAAYANDRSSTPHFMVDGEHADKIHQYVDIRGRAWHAGNANSKSVGIETAGGWEVTGPGLHQRFKPSPETHEQTAQLCAWLADELKLGDLVVGRNLKPHNTYSNTMCPGTLDLPWIAARANEIRKSGTRPAPATPKPTVEESMYVVFVDQIGHLLITPTFVRKIVDLPDASARDTVNGLVKLTKPVTVLPFPELYGIWSNVNAGTKDDSSTGVEIRALAKRLGVSR